MSSFTDLVRSRRENGQGVSNSLTESLREVVKEFLDPRKFLNQSGILTALFPQLKSYKAKMAKELKSGSNRSTGDSFSSTDLYILETNTIDTVKYTSAIPKMYNEFVSISKNISKLVRLEEGTYREESTQRWFEKESADESKYEEQFKIKKEDQEVKKTENKIKSITSMILMTGVALSLASLSSKANAMVNRKPSVGGGKSFNELNKDQQEGLLTAQYGFESGGKETSRATRLNNPGAMMYADWMSKYGATKDEDGFARFPTMEQGRDAQRQWWLNHGDMPIGDALRTYAPAASENEYQNYQSKLEKGAGTSFAASTKGPEASSASTSPTKFAETMVGKGELSDRSELRNYLGGVDPASEAWCATFVNASLDKSNIKGTGSAVATSFLNWGESVGVGDVKRDDVIVESRGRNPGQTGGHVGLATGRVKGNLIEMLSGNYKNGVGLKWVQSNQVQIRRARQQNGLPPSNQLAQAENSLKKVNQTNQLNENSVDVSGLEGSVMNGYDVVVHQNNTTVQSTKVVKQSGKNGNDLGYNFILGQMM